MKGQRYWDRLAPWYERLFAGGAARRGRRRGLELLEPRAGERVLFGGCGPGFELAWLGTEIFCLGVDLAPAMLRRAAGRLRHGGLVMADAQRLPLADGSFDAVALHLICAVAPDGATVLAEALRVTRPGGRVVIFDKFRRGPERPWWRLLGALGRRIGTDLNRPLEAVLAGAGGALVTANEPAALGGWFRLVKLVKPA